MRIAPLALAFALAAAGPALAFNDPTWPCESRKVVHLSIGQMWPREIPEDLDAWRDDPAIAQAAGEIAARRTPTARIEALVDEIAASTPSEDRARRLTDLFAGVFALIDRERARVVEGIVRYNASQVSLSAAIDAMQVELATLERTAAEDDYDALDRIDELRDAVSWEVRIFDERRRSLQYVCESPVILEQRAFAVARIIAARIDD